ncbi:MAG: amidoligase enzyme [Moorea sp. SIO2B7]|nr:amidoligase enzyme [Moorena sp. SIO2B7]
MNWKIGVEIELIAPRGLSRKTLAEAIAQAKGGTVQRFFHPQSEPSKVQGTPIFENLTLGFEVIDRQERTIVRCVDDITLQDDCDRNKPPKAGWYRIVSDDARLLRLVARQANPAAPLAEVLSPIATLFSTQLESGPKGMIRVADETGASIVIAAPLPSERERPCELITPPLEIEHLEHLESLLAIARSLGFTAPTEGATHLHFDATRLCSAPIFSNLVHILLTHGAHLRQLVGTNPRCRRLGNLPGELWQLVQTPEFRNLSWSEARERVSKLKLTKYCDFNLTNFINPIPTKHTFEVRIFPVWLWVQPIVEAAGLIEAILNRAIALAEISSTTSLLSDSGVLKDFINDLPMNQKLRKVWQTRATEVQLL